ARRGSPGCRRSRSAGCLPPPVPSERDASLRGLGVAVLLQQSVGTVRDLFGEHAFLCQLAVDALCSRTPLPERIRLRFHELHALLLQSLMRARILFTVGLVETRVAGFHHFPYHLLIGL